MFVQLVVTHIANIADDGILKVNCRLTKHYPFLNERKNSVLCRGILYFCVATIFITIEKLKNIVLRFFDVRDSHDENTKMLLYLLSH